MKKIGICLTLACILHFINPLRCQTPSWEWAHQAGGTNVDEVSAVAADLNRNVFTGGYFKSGSVTLGTTTLVNTASGNKDLFVSKSDLAGNVLWARSLSGSGNETITTIATDLDGNLLVGGSFGSSTLTAAPFTLNNPDAPYGDIFLVKYDSLGTILWANGSTGSSSDAIYGVATDSSGNIYAAGHYMSGTISFGSYTLTNASPGTMDIFVAKYDPSGNVIWAESYGGPSNDLINSVSVSSDNRLIAGGFFTSSSITIGSTTLTNASSGTKDILIFSSDFDGNPVWASSAGGSDDDEYLSVSADNWGNIYAGGTVHSSSITVGSSSFSNPTPGYGDVVIAKYNSSGSVLWADASEAVSSDALYSVSAGYQGDVYVTGHFMGSSINFGTTTLSNSATGTMEIFVAKYNLSGTAEWALSEGNAGNDLGKSISATTAGDVYVGGLFDSGSITFGSTSLTNSASGSNDGFISKLGLATSTFIQGNTGKIMVFPNPGSGQFTLDTGDIIPDLIEISDISGKVLLTLDHGQNDFDLGHFVKGLYFVKIIADGSSWTTKLVFH